MTKKLKSGTPFVYDENDRVVGIRDPHTGTDTDLVTAVTSPGGVVRLSVEGESLSMAMTRGPLKVGPNIPPSTALEIDSISQTAPTNTTEAVDTARFKTGGASVRLTSSTAGGTLQAQVSIPSITSSRWGSWVY